jgi:TPR repeat protein
MTKNYFRLFFYALSFALLLMLPERAFSQDSTKSLAIKKNSSSRRIGSMLSYRSSSFELADSYFLVKSANGGNVLAQHELGIRYLLGKGFNADTVKGAYWIQKAADKDLYNAKYNLGILQNNGWGVEWDPYEAYKNFLSAAKRDMPEAQLVVGVIHTENLIVPRDFGKAYSWVKLAADSGYAPAKEILEEFRKRNLIPDSLKDKSGAAKQETAATDSGESVQPFLFIEFDKDTNSVLYKEEKLKETLLQKRDEVVKAVGYTVKTPQDSAASSEELIKKAAHSGSSEALLLQGRMDEIGVERSPDMVKAAAMYIQAIRLESPKAPELLWKILQTGGFSAELKRRVDADDAEARFVWGCSAILGMDHQIDEQQAVDLINKAASQKYVPAIFELGFLHFSGNIVKQDVQKALQYWEEASSLGSSEARLRIELYNIFQRPELINIKELMPFLLETSDEGSVTSAVVLGYCYEKGIGVRQSYAMADKLYRTAAHRGSSAAYKSLLRLYDSFRPAGKEFQLTDE